MSYHPNPVREIIASCYGGPEKLYALADVVLSALTAAGYTIILAPPVDVGAPDPEAAR